MTTSSPVLQAFGGIDETAVAAWGSRMLALIRRNHVELAYHVSGGNFVTKIPVTGSKRRIAALTKGHTLYVAYGDPGELTVKFLAWDLLRQQIIVGPVTATPGSSPSVANIHADDLVLGYVRDGILRYRISENNGANWSEDSVLDPSPSVVQSDICSVSTNVIRWAVAG